MTNTNPTPSPSWDTSGKRDAELICLALDAAKVDWEFDQLTNVGNTVIADAVKHIPAKQFDEWHEGFMSKYMPWLASRIQGRN